MPNKDNSTETTSSSGDRSWTSPVHGTDSSGRDVTVAFGREGTSREGQALISDGHKPDHDFYGSTGSKGHDHAVSSDRYADRGQYSGSSDDDDD